MFSVGRAGRYHGEFGVGQVVKSNSFQDLRAASIQWKTCPIHLYFHLISFNSLFFDVFRVIWQLASRGDGSLNLAGPILPPVQDPTKMKGMDPYPTRLPAGFPGRALEDHHES